MLTNFEILVLTHFVSDWFLQPGNWAENKTKQFKPRLYHCIQYSALFIPVFCLLKMSLWWTVPVFITHILIDDYRFVNWVNRKVRGVSDKMPQWVPTVMDQILHVLVLAAIVAIDAAY
jgi:Protein of unknown function (DUF3307)